MKKFSVLTKDDVFKIFSAIDAFLSKEQHKLTVTILGGISLIVQDFINRSTVDIDIANIGDSLEFKEICLKHNIPVDIVAVVSTVDFERSSKVCVFNGKNLIVNSILAEDIIKSKLERFRKQDPEDIYAVIKKVGLNYNQFKLIAKDMLVDYVGNRHELLLSIMIVVENIYSEYKNDFEKDVF